jgi:hypothetical protein
VLARAKRYPEPKERRHLLTALLPHDLPIATPPLSSQTDSGSRPST